MELFIQLSNNTLSACISTEKASSASTGIEPLPLGRNSGVRTLPPRHRNRANPPCLLLSATPRSFIPDEHMVWCPEQLLQCVLAHIHYMPDHWRGQANKGETRDEVAQLFQYKAVSHGLG